ncbi:MAG: DUF1622 domain-containing protein [Patescibacteria group bacterium]
MDFTLDFITLIIKVIGSIIIVIGMAVSTYHFGRTIFIKESRLVSIRLEFGRYILLGLEFFIAADVIQTIFLPSWSELGMLATIVIIRTILSYFLTHEFRIIEKTKN